VPGRSVVLDGEDRGSADTGRARAAARERAQARARATWAKGRWFRERFRSDDGRRTLASEGDGNPPSWRGGLGASIAAGRRRPTSRQAPSRARADGKVVRGRVLRREVDARRDCDLRACSETLGVRVARVAHRREAAPSTHAAAGRPFSARRIAEEIARHSGNPAPWRGRARPSWWTAAGRELEGRRAVIEARRSRAPTRPASTVPRRGPAVRARLAPPRERRAPPCGANRDLVFGKERLASEVERRDWKTGPDCNRRRARTHAIAGGQSRWPPQEGGPEWRRFYGRPDCPFEAAAHLQTGMNSDTPRRSAWHQLLPSSCRRAWSKAAGQLPAERRRRQRGANECSSTA